MAITSLKLSDDLKQRAARSAHELGVSPHAFMIAAIEQATVISEQRASFLVDAKLARNETIEAGKGFKANDVHAYLKDKVSGKKASKPKETLWRA
ncbi:MAG: hypothetical protein H6R01_61 [Burkholderiaceae bacterium]|nr:hypothetical protein [Burkholderiaceae bacterium]